MPRGRIRPAAPLVAVAALVVVGMAAVGYLPAAVAVAAVAAVWLV